MHIKILIVLMAVLLAMAAYFFLFQVSGQEQPGQEPWTSYYTKAFCSRSFCEDIEVYCRGGSTVNIVPTGFTIQNSMGIQNTEQELCGD
jgi:hypothetical protein